MYADVKSDQPFFCHCYISISRTYSCAWHSEQGWIFSLFDRHAKNSKHPGVGRKILKVNLVNIYLPGTALGQQGNPRIKRYFGKLTFRTCPEVCKICRVVNSWFYKQRIKSGRGHFTVFFAIYFCHHCASQKSRGLHRSSING